MGLVVLYEYEYVLIMLITTCPSKKSVKHRSFSINGEACAFVSVSFKFHELMMPKRIHLFTGLVLISLNGKNHI